MSGAAQRREEALVACLALAPLLPFLGAAVSLDAPVFLAVARRILAAPLDPYGFDLVWDPTSPAVAAFNQNPPLLSYYLAPWIAAFGEREWILHAALLPFPLLAALSLLGIARRTGERALLAPLLYAATPAAVVLGTTLMLDVPMLALFLFSVYALLRGREAESGLGWPLAAGLAAAASGLLKYVGMASAPLLGAGVWLLYRRRGPALLSAVAVPLALWSAWLAFTSGAYGRPHLLGATEIAADKSLLPRELLGQLLSVPVYYGAALCFPIFAWGRALLGRTPGLELAVAAALAGAGVAYAVLPAGLPPRRGPLQLEEAVLAALSFGAAVFLVARCLRPGPIVASREQAFLALWLAGFGVFSLAVNWHVNAADALLAAPPLLLLLARDAALRPGPRLTALWCAATLSLSLGLAWAESAQAGAYRLAAREIAEEIGERGGGRWFVGHWGLQYYLEREGFRAVAPPHYGGDWARERIQTGDWIVSAVNLTQMDVGSALAGLRVREVRRWQPGLALPLRTNNPDAGAGFYSHHVGYVPWAWSRARLEDVALGRVEYARSSPADR